MNTTERTEPISPKRVISFAKFFKNYMSVSTIVTAALPIPVTAFNLIPTFHVQTKLLSVYTSLFCFLILGFIFYIRHELARIMFPDFSQKAKRRPQLNKLWRLFISFLPLLLIASSIIAAFQYNDVLNLNVNAIIENGLLNDQMPTFTEVLERAQPTDLKYGSRLMVLYLAIFVLAEAAFVLMAIKEYLQDLIGLEEMDLILLRSPPEVASDQTTAISAESAK
jgi:hypothetical protein